MHERTVIPLIAWLCLLLILITPVTLRLDVRFVQQAEVTVAPHLWGLGPDLRYRLERTEQGHRVFRVSRSGRLKPLKGASSASARPVIRQALRDDHVRRLLLRGISLLKLDIAMNVSLGDAARTALTAGTLQSLWRALPSAWRHRARLQVRPDFLGGQGGIQARCMVFFHLGTLLITAAVLLMSCARERTGPSVHPAKEA